MKKSFVLAIVLTAGMANAELIDFESDTAGPIANGFMSASSANVTFSDTMGSDLQIGDWGVQGDGQSIGVFSDDASRLLMTFTDIVTDLTLDFGNDDPSRAPVFAFLRGLLGGAETGLVSVAANNDDIMNQSISIFGNFDQIEFFYANADGSPLAGGLIEIVDNIQFTIIPAPGSAMLFGIAGIAAVRRRR